VIGIDAIREKRGIKLDRGQIRVSKNGSGPQKMY
jgi:hypothetical protein